LLAILSQRGYKVVDYGLFVQSKLIIHQDASSVIIDH